MDGITEGGVAAAPRILIPETEYEAQATGFKIVPFHQHKKIYLRLRIIAGEHFGKEVWCVLQHYDKFSPRSYFYQAWVIAQQRLPRRGERLHPNHLCGHVFRIRSRTVATNERGDPIPELLRYSVAEIISLIQQTHNSSPGTDNPLPQTNYRLPTLPSLRNGKKRGFG